MGRNAQQLLDRRRERGESMQRIGLFREGRKLVAAARGFIADAEDIMQDMRKWFGNKGPWMWHLEQWHAGLTPGMEAHFYLARLEGRLIGNVTVFRNGAFGAIYHVFTVPDSRRLGVAKALLEAATTDFEQDFGQVLVLAATRNRFTWQLYESVGFVGICPEYGGMVRFFQGTDWPDLFKYHPARPHRYRRRTGFKSSLLSHDYAG